MSTPLVSGDHIVFRSVTSLGGQVAINSFHYAITAVGGSPATDQDLCTDFASVVASLIKATLPNEAQWRGVLANILGRLIPPIGVQDTLGAGPGTNGILPLPKQACGITSYYTTLTGPKYRGRTYWPFLASNFADVNGEITNAGKAALAAVVAALVAFTTTSVGGRTATHEFVIYHRDTNTSNAVKNTLARNTVATQRRRGDYGRPNVPPL